MLDQSNQQSLFNQLALELSSESQVDQALEPVNAEQVAAAVGLLDDGASVPFIARYRKEATQGMSDTHLRKLEDRLAYLRDLAQQKTSAIESIQAQGKLTPPLRQRLLDAQTKQQLADLYLPFRTKRKSKASQAIEAGLEPLADQLWQNPNQDPMTVAKQYLKPDQKIETEKQALDGARQILAERWAESPELITILRDHFREQSKIFSKRKVAAENSAKPAPATVKSSADAAKQAKKAQKFVDYYDWNEPLKKIASHRVLALFRGRRENVLNLALEIEHPSEQTHPCVGLIHQFLEFSAQERPGDQWLAQAIAWSWRVKFHPKLENDLLAEIKERADQDSIEVFACNLKNLLMSAPAGQKVTIGLDPGVRTGVKVAVSGNMGQVLEHTTIYPHAPKNQWDQSIAVLAKLALKHQAELVAIGNGTASRETDKLVSQLMKTHPELKLKKAIVNEAGASIYSASEYASRELPGLDVSIRGAVSIARRLQDPLAELVKIEPKAIGVGQYQHDVSQPKLARSLESVVEDCVNAVGVDVNTASTPLLARIAGLNTTIAQNIVGFREQNGAFKSREQLKQVPRFGNKTFEQAAGFLRIHNGENILDGTAVHPECYPLVHKIANQLDTQVPQLVRRENLQAAVPTEQLVDEQFGTLTVQDVLAELEKPGRDPRPEFSVVEFRDDVQTLADLKTDMTLDGIVTNVTNFGAFVDVGVHHDGLVHISALAERFVDNPHQIVKAGDQVKVKVLAVDIDRQRIDLTMRLGEPAPARPQSRPQSRHPVGKPGKSTKPSKQPQPAKAAHSTQQKAALPPGKTGTFADLFAAMKQEG